MCMKVFFLLLSLGLSYEIHSCSTCKFLKRDITDIHYGKCTRYPVKKTNDYHYSYTARLYTRLCGKDGKNYEPLGK